MSHKSLIASVYNEKSSTQPRVITGVAAVFGNVDHGGDVVAPGAFRNAVAAFKAGRSRVKLLWQHDASQPPVGKVLDIKEVGRDQLPAAVLAKDPTATGGLIVKRQYFKDEFSNRVYEGILSGAISEMSFAYSTKKSRFENREGGKRVQILEDLDLFDVSDVNFGMNAATVAAGAKGRGRASTALPLPLWLRVARLKAFHISGGLEGLKSRSARLERDIINLRVSALLERRVSARR